MVRTSRPAPLMLDEPFMLFSGPCSAAEQGAGMLSPCSASSQLPTASLIHVHPHTVAGSRAGGAHFNAPSPPLKPRPAAATAAAGPPPPRAAAAEATGAAASKCGDSSGSGSGLTAGARRRALLLDVAPEEIEAHQSSLRSESSDHLEACLDLPQRPATTRARNGAFNSFFFSRRISSGANTPAAPGSNGKKKKRAFPGFTPRGLSGVGFGSFVLTPQHRSSGGSLADKQQHSGAGAERLGKQHSCAPSSSSSGGPGSSPILGSLTRGASFIALLTRRPSPGPSSSSSNGNGGPSSLHAHSGQHDDMDASASTSANSSISTSTTSSHNGNAALPPALTAASYSPPPLHSMNFHYDGTKILEWLYMGGESIPSQQALAQTFGITHIVNTTMDAHYPHHDPAKDDYCQLFLRDCVRQKISPETFQRAFDMIERARHHGEKCLVHCRNGMSRSATVVIAYLLRYQGMRLIDALAHTRARRPCVSPNPGFMDQLCEMERGLFGDASLNSTHYHDDRFAAIESLRLPALEGLPELLPVSEELPLSSSSAAAASAGPPSKSAVAAAAAAATVAE